MEVRSTGDRNKGVLGKKDLAGYSIAYQVCQTHLTLGQLFILYVPAASRRPMLSQKPLFNCFELEKRENLGGIIWYEYLNCLTYFVGF